MGEKKLPKKLTIDEILKNTDLKEEEFYVEEWDGTITLKPLSMANSQRCTKKATVDGGVDAEKMQMYMFIEAVVDPQITEEQYNKLNEGLPGPMIKILTKINEISGIGDNIVPDAKVTFRD